ncbi:MAG TPA: 6-oxocyclohex-1-ene-1-carbonyl-CoA hydratase [Pseudomonadota bacterium]|nr:6-oxocyclohex-1-ene-1-carbonyl-CoA hydratase [Pseudomonadota bacterium]HNN51445.1 6-oxocyclohex-1-ene-1-carbonyl-CoA hydratase [Pseudomonadota bacterium]
MSESFPFKNHDIAPDQPPCGKVRYDLIPCLHPSGAAVSGLYSAWITLDNPTQFNSYTTEMVKDVILSFRRASNARDVVSVVFTGSGERAFCTGGNTKEYAEYYAGRPSEYAQYMRLFNDMVTAILHCDKPVICRVNGMRIAGGQEIGMACDFSIASDLATFGQAGPKHGSAPDGGSTDFLPLFVGIEQAMQSCTLCQPWTSYQAHRLGLLTDVIPVLCVDGRTVRNPLCITDRYLDDGKLVYGNPKQGAELSEAKTVLSRGKIDLSPLDAAVQKMVTQLLLTMPGCTSKTIESVRKHKLAHWDKNRETNRSWLALNMMTEAQAGFRAFNEGTKESREVDFIALRQKLAQGEKWGPQLIESVLPKANRG